MSGRRIVVLAAVVPAAIAATAGSAGAADECRGIPVCISVPGPWVVVAAPNATTPPPASSWLLRCPEGTIGGLDARLTRPEIDLSFAGLLGSPVSPGQTTSNGAFRPPAARGRRPSSGGVGRPSHACGRSPSSRDTPPA